MARTTRIRVSKRALALLLAIISIWTSVVWPPIAVQSNPVSSLSESLPENTSGTYVMLDGERVQEILLMDDAKLRLQAIYNGQVSAYQWQIRDPGNESRWFDISGGFSDYQWVTHALVGSMLNKENIAYLRCRMLTGNE